MSDATDSKAWPGTKFFGDATKYDEYATDQEGWAIENKIDSFLESKDPSTIPRVEAPYTVHVRGYATRVRCCQVLFFTTRLSIFSAQ